MRLIYRDESPNAPIYFLLFVNLAIDFQVYLLHVLYKIRICEEHMGSQNSPYNYITSLACEISYPVWELCCNLMIRFVFGASSCISMYSYDDHEDRFNTISCLIAVAVCCIIDAISAICELIKFNTGGRIVLLNRILSNMFETEDRYFDWRYTIPYKYIKFFFSSFAIFYLLFKIYVALMMYTCSEDRFQMADDEDDKQPQDNDTNEEYLSKTTFERFIKFHRNHQKLYRPKSSSRKDFFFGKKSKSFRNKTMRKHSDCTSGTSEKIK